MLIAGGRAAAAGHVALHDVRSGRRLSLIGDELDAVMNADLDASLQHVAIGGTNKLVKVFSAQTGEPLFEMNKHTDWVTACEFSPDGKFLATADRSGGLMLWETATGREDQAFKGHAAAITAISWRADSQLFATASEDGDVRCWSRR